MSINLIYYLAANPAALTGRRDLAPEVARSRGGVGGKAMDAMRARSVDLGTMAQKRQGKSCGGITKGAFVFMLVQHVLPDRLVKKVNYIGWQLESFPGANWLIWRGSAVAGFRRA